MRTRTVGRALAGLLSLLTLAALVGGLPVALYAVGGGSPVPHSVPSWHHILAVLTEPDHGQVFLATVRWAAWAGWAVFTLSAVMEVLSVARGRAAPHLAGLGPVQGFAAALVGAAIVGLLPGFQAARTIPPPRPAQTVATAPPAPARGPASHPAGETLDSAATRVPRGPFPARRETCRVVAGDSLWSIAARHLGDGERWREIWALNDGRPQPGAAALTDPGLIYPGWTLLLPHTASHHTNPSSRPAPAQPPPSAAPHHQGNGRGPAPGQHATPRPVHTHSHHAHPAPPLIPHRRQRPAGVHLPDGGLVGITLAAAVSAALVAWRLHRRRIPLDGWPTPAAAAEPPLPGAIQAMRRAHLRSLAADQAEAHGEPWPDDEAATEAWLASLTDDDEDGDGLDEFGAPTGPIPVPPAAVHASGERDEDAAVVPLAAPPPAMTVAVNGTAAVLRDDWPPPPPAKPQSPGTVTFASRGGREIPFSALPGGAGLTGPGAEAVGRALLISVLAAGHGAQVVISEPVLRLLTGRQPQAPVPGVTPGLPDGLTVTPSLGDALSHLETLITRRARLLEEQHPGDEAPPLVLFATPEPGTAVRLRAIIEAGDAAGLAAVIVGGDHPTGLTCRAGDDGTVLAATDPALAGAQASHLPAASTAAMLTLLRGAQGHLTTPQPAAGPPAADGPSSPRPPRDREASRNGASPTTATPPTRTVTTDGPPAGAAAEPAGAAAPPVAAGAQPGDATAAPGPVQLRVLGPVQIHAGGTEVKGGLRKARELLAYLALYPEGVTAEAAGEALWPGQDPRYSSRQRALALRRARDLLRAATGRTAPMFIFLADDRYRLDPNLIDVDLWAFNAALDRARHATTEQAQLAAFTEAASLYRGPLTDGASYDWTEQFAEDIRRRAADALTRLAGLLTPTDPAQALEALEKAITHDPHNEAVYLAAMRVQNQLGRPDAVRRTLDHLHTSLAEIGATPTPETQHAAAALTSSSPPG